MIDKSCVTCVCLVIVGDPVVRDYPEDNDHIQYACCYGNDLEESITEQYWENNGRDCPYWSVKDRFS